MAMTDPGPGGWNVERRAFAWFNLGIQAVLLAGLLVVINLIARRSPQRFDLTSRQSFSLSNQTEDLLKRLNYSVEIWINPAMYTMSDDKSLSVAVYRTQDLLEEFQHRCSKIRVKRISPDEVDETFARNWTTIAPATLYFLATPETGKVNKKAIEVQQLYTGNSVTGEVTAYRGEAAIAAAIRELGGTVKHVVYESEGHQEYVTGDASLMGRLREHLVQNEGIEFRRITLNDYQSIPADCELLMILGPNQNFLPHEIEVIRDYVERGGSVLAAMRARAKTGLEKLLEEYNVVVGDNVVHDAQQYFGPRMSNLRVRDFNLHDVNRSMVNIGFYMPNCCTIDPVERKDPSWQVTALAMAGPNSWAETEPLTPGYRPRPKPGDRQGHLKVMVAVEKPASNKTDERHKRARIDVWGTAEAFWNNVLSIGGRPNEIQMQYIVNHFRWLMDRELLAIDMANVRVKPLQLTDDQLSRLGWIVMAGFPSFGVALGLLAWFVRRK